MNSHTRNRQPRATFVDLYISALPTKTANARHLPTSRQTHPVGQGHASTDSWFLTAILHASSPSRPVFFACESGAGPHLPRSLRRQRLTCLHKPASASASASAAPTPTCTPTRDVQKVVVRFSCSRQQRSSSRPYPIRSLFTSRKQQPQRGPAVDPPFHQSLATPLPHCQHRQSQ
jgi:hypothetical protein